ncbi:MAG: CDGSH iron-sulfur domain-containing protein [Chloroflexi bacterium]|jgi:CDGSH-type Zn-finger protein|nr:CDGSH iron-sulfur domain-containing protein [Chloroflexota bacterium]
MSDVTIRVRDNGNLKIEGSVALLDGEGNPIPVAEGQPLFLCRCGMSRQKPFCDSSHREAGFASLVRAEPAAEPAAEA